MDNHEFDVAIAGGGLAGGLIALALFRANPKLSIALIEGGSVLGGNHRWSWFESDLTTAGLQLLAGFETSVWRDGYDVRFPAHGRSLQSVYRSLSSAEFHDALIDELPASAIVLNQQITALDGHGATLADGRRITASIVIDCRGFAPSRHLSGGWQVFLGQHLKLETPHARSRPIIMDADVDQHAPHGNGGAYRFVYSLPLAPDEMFVEDTYYADSPRLDREVLSSRVAAYAERQGWRGAVAAQETGVLPVITGGDFASFQNDQRKPGVAIAGARGGFSHPLTSYTLPVAVDIALAIAAFITSPAQLPSGSALAEFCERRARAHWSKTRFYRLLARMLFYAAKPEKRFVIFERFYRLPEKLIERFYAGNSSVPDRVRILVGKPPVSILSAIRALARKGNPLTTEKSA